MNSSSALVLLWAIGMALSYPWAEMPDIDSEEFGQHNGPLPTNCSCGWTNKAALRIVNGVEAGVNQYPYMAGLGFIHPLQKERLLGVFCGATIVTGYHALTAAHCTYDDHVAPIGIVVGEHDLSNELESGYTRMYPVARVVEHPGWNPKISANDISVLVTKQRIVFNEAVGPACLPSPVQPDLVGQFVKVTGWGRTRSGGDKSKVLLKVNLKVVSRAACMDAYPTRAINNNQICTYRNNKDSCQGDSGGPVTWLDSETNRYTLVGVVSFGAGCATKSPGVNTNVAAFIGWIQKTIKETSPTPVATCAKVA
uniref:Venom S1 protease 15 n=1 Tax=Lethocerus distinctifemur TaxID=280095 RepID=A0A2K8JLQ3_9HEMI|nr:venom S1 protease 15 [Lethocerus distinctifemur]